MGKSQMVGVRGLSTADQARTLSDRFDMFSVTDPAWLRQGQQALVDDLCPPPSPAFCFIPFTRAAPRRCRALWCRLRVVCRGRDHNVPSLPWKASSTRWASGAVSLFLSPRDRCAHIAASSAERRLVSSTRSRSVSSVDALGARTGLTGFRSLGRRGAIPKPPPLRRDCRFRLASRVPRSGLSAS